MNGGSPDPVAARDWLQAVVAANQQRLKDFLDSKVDLTEEYLAERFPHQSGPLPPQFGGIAAMLLLQWSQNEPAAFNFLRRILADLVRSGEAVPEVWRNLQAGILDGTVSAPKAKNGRRRSHDRRDELVSIVVAMLQGQFNLSLSANPLSRNGNSAIEIIQVELSKICPGLVMVTDDAIEKAIKRRGKSRGPITRVLDRGTE